MNYALYVSASTQNVEVYHLTPLPYNCLPQYGINGSTVVLSHANSLPMMGGIGA